MGAEKYIELEQVGQLRQVSKKISEHLDKRLQDYLATLKPLFLPRKVLGEYMDSAYDGRVAGADKNITAIGSSYQRIAQDAFGLSTKLGTPVPSISSDLTIAPWEYIHELDGGQRIIVTSPVRWVLNYKGEYSLSELMKQSLKDEPFNAGGVKDLLIRTLTLSKLLEMSPGLQAIFEDLRFQFSLEKSAVSGDLQHVVLSCDVPAFRPQNEAIQTVVSLSGKAVFEELIDHEELGNLVDPFKKAVTEFV